MNKKIVITGSSGRFGLVLKKKCKKKNFYFPSKKILDITNEKKIEKYLNKIKPDILIHLAGLSRPMQVHEKNITLSINLNIIGTANIVKACQKRNIKLIYFSTNYVYPGIKGNYSEVDPINPVNNYAWSKLGGEASVKLYKNSLILRVCMTEKPFVHKKAYGNVKTSFAYHEEIAENLLKLLDKRGVINLGGKAMYIYDFAKQENKSVKKIYLNKNKKNIIPFNSSLNLNKFKNLIKKN
ncbi:ligand-binding protein, RmlD family [alpha proteobacterium HIMB5]|nr:ligand-binding protein, RmlD family [alpha proteobacterium HIMB5]